MEKKKSWILFFSLSFIKFLLSYVTPNPSTKMVKNEVLKTWVFDENIKKA